MRSIRPASTTLAVCAALALVVTACGGGNDAAVGTTASSSEHDDGMGDMDGGDHESFAFGEPADEADADRTIEVEARDDLTYDPPSIEVAAGETVTFVVTNPGATAHEFVLGDAHLQEEHAEEMREMMSEGMQMHDEPNAIALQPGETKRLTWHFTEAGSLEFACHQPGHYAGGMKGTLTVG